MQQVDLEHVADFARSHHLEFVAQFGSQARGDARPDSDLDLAVMPGTMSPGRSGLLALTRDLIHALPSVEIDVCWLPDTSWLLAWQIARDGQPLYERQPGAFRSFQRVATRRHMASGLWVRKDREYMDRFLKGRLQVDVELVRRRLNQMGQYLREMAPIIETPQERFVDDPFVHHTAERLVELLVECAADVNTEVAQAVGGIPPSDYYSSFFSMARVGWVTRETADVLAVVARTRNILVHQYEELQLADLYDHVIRTEPAWRAYLASVHENLGKLGA